MSISDLIVSKPPLMVGSSAIYKFDEKLAKQFTLKTRFGDVFKLFEQQGDNILLPRAVCPAGSVDKRTAGRPIKIKTIFKPRNEEQSRIVDEATGLLMDGHSFILQASTGFGKTVITTEIAARVGRATLIVVPKEDLMVQWVDAISKFWNIPKSKIGIVRQDVCDYKGKDIVVGMLHSLVKKGKYPASLYSSFGLVVFDEVHRIAADSFMTLCNMLDAKLRLGLSATPERKDGKDVALYAHIGPIMVKTSLQAMKFKVLRFYSDWVCPRQKRTDPHTGETYFVKIPHEGGKCMHVVRSLMKDQKRNKKLVSFIKTAYEKDRDIIIFSDIIEHLEMLRAMCIKAGLPQTDMCMYTSGLTAKERELAKVIRMRFSTYGMMAEGTDIPWADTCIFASPRAGIEQMIGRIVREYPDKKQPVAFDLIDQDSPVFNSYANSRMAFYKKKDAEVVTLS